LILTIASAARAASPPLSASSTRARAQACAGNDVEMDRIAANDAAERNDPVVGTLLAFRRFECHRDRGGNLQRARHADAVEGDAFRLEHAASAREQRIGDIVVEPRLDDENARSGDIALFAPVGSARLGHSRLRKN